VIGFAVLWAFYAGDLGRYEAADLTLPAPLWWEGAVAAIRDAAALSAESRWDAASGLEEPTLVVLLGLGVAAWWFLRRDRADTPSLLVVMGPAALVTAVLVPPRLAPVALAAALPPLALLTAAFLVRLGRHARLVGIAATAVLLVGVAAGWHAAAPWDAQQTHPPSPTAEGQAAQLQPDEAWLLDRWIKSRAPKRVVTLLARKPMLRATADSRIEEMAPDAERLEELLAEIDRGADVALVVADWARIGDDAPKLGGREPDTRFLRLSVYGRR
jgi:hypothetical protein